MSALSLSRGSLLPPNDPSGFEAEMSGKPTRVVAIGVGHWRGEGMALLEAVS
jgi:3-oxoacyl-[acyl-carrier-protein] synthase II